MLQAALDLSMVPPPPAAGVATGRTAAAAPGLHPDGSAPESTPWAPALPPPDEEEEDMLDLAFGLTDTSRLGCQIAVAASHDGMVVTIPQA